MQKMLSLLLLLAATSCSGALREQEPIFTAADQGDITTTLELLDAGAAINGRDGFQDTLLHHAAFHGHHKLVEILLTRGANINAQGKGNATALNWAVFKNHLKVVQTLLRYGADVNLPDAGGCTPLHRLARESEPIARALLTAGAHVSAQNKTGITPLHLITVLYPHDHALKALLLEYGAVE